MAIPVEKLQRRRRAWLSSQMDCGDDGCGLCRVCRRLAFHKPKGLWVSVEGEYDWKSWCEAEQWGLADLACATEVVLSTNARILHIATHQELLDFGARFGCRAPFAPDHDKYWDAYAVRWDDVAKNHDGVVIAPYQWGSRHSDVVKWYYGWDCASGCIWRMDAIAELRRVKDYSFA